jgi:hypothetical protein
MAIEWYVARDGKTYGPFTPEEMTAGARDGELRRDDLVWRKGMPYWQPAADLPGLWPPPPPALLAAPTREPAPPATSPTPATPPPPAVAAAATPAPRAEARHDAERQAEPAESAPKRAGFIRRHWRGELGLPKAYWGVGVLLTLVAVGLAYGFGATVGAANLSPVAGGIAMLCFLSFLCIMTVWQLVGIWRSAGNHIRTTGRTVWGALARVAVVVGVVRSVVEFSTVIWPMLSESAMLAAGRDNIPAHRLRLLRNGTELELAGGMPFGTADALKNVLDAAPAVRVLHLNSMGGRVAEGYQIYQIVRDRNLITYTATDCVSACTIAFLGGSQRYLSSRARLGFHSLSYGGVDQTRLPDINTDLRQMLVQHGAPQWFIDKALTTGADSMWYPPTGDLIAAKIVTRVVDPDQFAMSGVGGWRDTDALERSLLSSPIYALIKASDPEGFKKIAGRFAEAVRLGKSEPEVIQDVQAVLGTDVLPKYLNVAPDGAIQRYWRAQIAEMEHLSKTDPALCVAFAFPEQRREGYNVNKLVPRDLLTEDIAALTELVRQATSAPQMQKPANLDQEFAGVMDRISKRLPRAQDVLAYPGDYFNDPRTLCDALLAFYHDVLNLPPQRSGPMLRSLAEPPR